MGRVKHKRSKTSLHGKVVCGASRQTSRYVDHEERHIYYGVWPCCDLDE
jgi:hypothetical protein